MKLCLGRTGAACTNKLHHHAFVRYCSRQRLYRNSVRFQSNQGQNELAKIRNIGIIAHIDAGKTTTTERMLYYSGQTQVIGNVDDGSTVTDFLPAERARGITIQSAAVTFKWPQEDSARPSGSDKRDCHTVNLIDTPGHSDFGFEVTRSLRVLDGAVCILDGVAGVEAQTEKVWFQAEKHKIPRIIYVNKLDREGAAFGRSVKEVAARLHVWPAVCQIPWYERGTGPFKGVVDIIGLTALRWPSNTDGHTFEQLTLEELERVEPVLAKSARLAREALIELLSGRDESLIEEWERCGGDYLGITSSTVLRSLRSCLLQDDAKIVPIFAGASFRNIGVQPLLDAVVDLLPSPAEVPDPQVSAGEYEGTFTQLLNRTEQSLLGSSRGPKHSKEDVEACALAFKVVNDARRGTLVYVRVYQGALKPGSLVFNTQLQVQERIPRLLQMMASDAQSVSTISAGQIGVIPGLKTARTGDTLITFKGMNPKVGPPPPFRHLQLRPIDVPPPVFFTRVEPHSLGEVKAVDEALRVLLREDPSLHVTTDADSGQTQLSGMGELHLEIARDRLIHDLKANAHVGKIEIGYRERVTASATVTDSIYERDVLGKTSKCGCSAIVDALEEGDMSPSSNTLHRWIRHEDGNVIETHISEVDSDLSLPDIPSGLSLPDIHRALQSGALSALGRGPIHLFRCHGVSVRVEFDARKHSFGRDTTVGAMAAASRLAVSKALRASGEASQTSLVEPVMSVTISINEQNLGNVVQDISSSRSGHVVSISGYGEANHDSGSSVSHSSDLELIDLSKVYAPKDPFVSAASDENLTHLQTGDRQRTVLAKIPLREMIGYLKHLRSITAGRGTFTMTVDRFEKMNAALVRSVMKELRGV